MASGGGVDYFSFMRAEGGLDDVGAGGRLWYFKRVNYII